MPTPTPRSIYAQKLRGLTDFAFGDQSVFQHRGRWRDFFRPRIGPSFDGRIIFEVGCADAAYLGKIAAKYLNTAFVGLDWKCKALYDGARRIAELGMKNIALLRGRGQDVHAIFAELEVDEIWVFHPDPCDRAVELTNRLIGQPFLTDVHQVLRDTTSVLSLKTDHPGYYQWVLALFGLPQPPWFATTCKHDCPTPRLRVRDLMPPEQIPQPNPAIQDRFDIASNSPDYWHDPAALAHSAGRCFAGTATFFESRFIQKRLPIYYFEMRKK